MLQKKFTKVLLNKYASNTKILLLLIVLFGLILRLLFFTGIGPSDSVFYTKYAYDISTNNLNFFRKSINIKNRIIDTLVNTIRYFWCQRVDFEHTSVTLFISFYNPPIQIWKIIIQ